jgi:hypothetical protein
MEEKGRESFFLVPYHTLETMKENPEKILPHALMKYENSPSHQHLMKIVLAFG